MNVLQFDKSFKNIDLEFDEIVSQFMDECQCTYGFTLPAIDSRFVSEHSISEEVVNEILKLNNIKIKKIYSFTRKFLSYLTDLKEYLSVFGPDYSVEVAHVFDYVEGWNYTDSFVLGCDGVAEFCIKFLLVLVVNSFE